MKTISGVLFFLLLMFAVVSAAVIVAGFGLLLAERYGTLSVILLALSCLLLDVAIVLKLRDR